MLFALNLGQQLIPNSRYEVTATLASCLPDLAQQLRSLVFLFDIVALFMGPNDEPLRPFMGMVFYNHS